ASSIRPRWCAPRCRTPLQWQASWSRPKRWSRSCPRIRHRPCPPAAAWVAWAEWVSDRRISPKMLRRPPPGGLLFARKYPVGNAEKSCRESLQVLRWSAPPHFSPLSEHSHAHFESLHDRHLCFRRGDVVDERPAEEGRQDTCRTRRIGGPLFHVTQ